MGAGAPAPPADTGADNQIGSDDAPDPSFDQA
jgi:hypothetical protein